MNKEDTKTETTIEREQTISTNVSSLNSTSSKDRMERKNANLITHDEIIGHDYQGWPLYHLRVISFLRVLGVSEDIIKQIPEDILKTQISSIDEDGMGYGINEECIVDCTIDKNKNIVYLWRMPLTNANNVD